MTIPKGEANTIEKAKAYVLGLFSRQADSRWVFHNYKQGIEVAHIVEDIAAGEKNISENDLETAKLASLFLIAGYVQDYQSPIKGAKEVCATFVQENPDVSDEIREVENCLLEQETETFQSDAGKLLHDAVLGYLSFTSFFNMIPLLRLEEELLAGNVQETVDWEQDLLNRLLADRFYTHFGKTTFEPTLQNNLLHLKEKIQTLQNKKKKGVVEQGMSPRVFQGLEPKGPGRGAQTFFRSVYRNHINLSAIADNKANLMTGINAVLISVVISILSYGTLTLEQPAMMMPISCFWSLRWLH